MDELKIRIETEECIYEEWIIEWGENYDKRIIHGNFRTNEERQRILQDEAKQHWVFKHISQNRIHID